MDRVGLSPVWPRVLREECMPLDLTPEVVSIYITYIACDSASYSINNTTVLSQKPLLENTIFSYLNQMKTHSRLT